MLRKKNNAKEIVMFKELWKLLVNYQMLWTYVQEKSVWKISKLQNQLQNVVEIESASFGKLMSDCLHHRENT